MKKADMIKRVAEWNKKITKECEKKRYVLHRVTGTCCGNGI